MLLPMCIFFSPILLLFCSFLPIERHPKDERKAGKGETLIGFDAKPSNRKPSTCGFPVDPPHCHRAASVAAASFDRHFPPYA